jgi:hypothetical protein
MFRWYEEAKVCYAFLHDVRADTGKKIRDAEWFVRGWTLQELIAPEEVDFYDGGWNLLGTSEG